MYINTAHCILLYNIVFSPLQVENKLCEGILTPAFIVRPISMVANTDYYDILWITEKNQLSNHLF